MPEKIRDDSPYDARLVANYFLELAKREGVPVTPLKIQKLVYLAHGWSLVLLEKALIKQSPEAWPYGPVIPSLYRAFKSFGGGAITQKAPTVGDAKLDPQSEKLIKAVWDKYKRFSAAQLSTLTHEPGSAWQVTVKNAWPFEPLTIRNDLIVEEFERRRQANVKPSTD